MAAPATIDEFLDLVTRSGVADAGRLKAYVEQMRSAGGQPAEVTQMAGLLVRDGLLTYFQAEQILQGKWKRFTVGKYKILERLGAGGMGQVFLCEHLLMKTRVAVKVLPASKADDPAALERFYREARAAAALDHPNIVRAYDIDKDDQLHFLVMAYVDGSSLHDIVKKFGPMDIPRVCRYVHDAAIGLQFAFENGLIHRDIKPGNIIIDRAGTVRILDMGLARFFNDADDDITRKFEEVVLGTADYLAPEQAVDSHSVDVRADIYSLGATMYYMLGGRAPFAEGTVAQKLLWHQSREPDPIEKFRPKLPERIGEILRKMMAKDKAKRYQLPIEIAEALAPFAPADMPPPPDKEMPQLSLAARPPGSGSPSSVSRMRKPSPSRIDAPAAEPSHGPGAPEPERAPAPVQQATAIAEPEKLWENVTAETLEVIRPDTDRKKARKSTPANNPFLPEYTPIPTRRRPSRRPLAAALIALPLLLAAVWHFALWDRAPVPVPAPPSNRLYVSRTAAGPDTYTTLKAAVEAARDGDRIILRDSVWDESLTVSRSKKITVESEGQLPTVWRARRAGQTGSVLSLNNCAGLTLRNLVFDADPEQWDHAVRITGSSAGLTLDGIEFRGARIACLALVSARGEDENPILVQRCRFLGRSVEVPAGADSPARRRPECYSAIAFLGGSDGEGIRFLQVRDCRFEGVRAEGPNGLAAAPDGFEQALFIQCNQRECTFANNRLTNIGYGVRYADWKSPTSRMRFENNTFFLLKSAAFWFDRGSEYSDERVVPNTRIEIARNYFSQLPTPLAFNSIKDKKVPDAFPNLVAADNACYLVKAPAPFFACREVNEHLETDRGNNREFLFYPKGSELSTLANGKPVGAVFAEPAGDR